MGEHLKKMKAKVIHKYEYERDWLLSNYVPDIGEVVFYKPEITEAGEPDFTVLPEGRTEPITYTRQKNGDGINTVSELPFATTNLINGEGAKSIKLDSGDGQKALSRYSASFGEESIAGILGYHFSNIDFENKIITLNDSVNKQSSVPTSETNYINPKQFAINWSVGDVICIINSSKYDLCSTITAINENQITVNEFPFTAIKSMSVASIDYDDYSVFNPNAPTEGVVDLAPAAFVSGVENLSAGAGTHTEGKQNKSIGHYAHSEGRKTVATYNAHAEGYKTEARGQGTHAEGHETIGNGKAAHVEGYQSKAEGQGAHAEGVKSKASDLGAHAEGSNTEASNRGAHAEGVNTKATGDASHAEGYTNEANGAYSHVGGHDSKAEGTNAFAHGAYVTAKEGQSVFGSYNIPNENALAQWGNGTKNNTVDKPSNAFEILKDGTYNYQDPIEGYTNSTNVRKKTARAINDNYNHYQNTLKNNIDNNFELTRREDLGSGVIYSYSSEEQFISRDTNDQYYGDLNNRGELYNISSNLIIKENHGYNQRQGLKFDFRDDGGVYISGVLDKEPGAQYVQFVLLDDSGKYTSFTKDLIKFFIRYNDEKILYLKLKSSNLNMIPTRTILQVSYKLTPKSDTQYFNVRDNEVDCIELNENSELYSIYLQIDVSDIENGTEFNTLVYPYVSFGREANERGQILTIPTEYNSYWALLKEGFLYCNELELVSFYKSKIATKEEVNIKAPAIHEHEIEDVNGLQEIVEQISNENNSFVQKGNAAIGENTASFGASNANFSDYSFTEGLMNIAGANLDTILEVHITSAETGNIVIDNENLYVSKIFIDEAGYESLNYNFKINDPIVIFAENYYSCRFISTEPYDIEAGQYILNVLNHNVVSGINNACNNGLEHEICVYKINASNNCHTEHIEGAYNISAETGDGAKSSRVSHIEGHTNISFGQYNHIEGVQNKALNQTEFTHIEGRMNTVDGGEGKNDKVSASHVRGRSNTLVNSNQATITGSYNTVVDSGKTFVGGTKNSVTNAVSSHVGGESNEVTNVINAIVHGNGLKASGNNKAVFGAYNEEDSEALLIFGNGTADAPNNAMTINNNGTVSVKAEPEKASDVVNKGYFDTKFAEVDDIYSELYTTNLVETHAGSNSLASFSQKVVLKDLYGESYWDGYANTIVPSILETLNALTSSFESISRLTIPAEVVTTSDYGMSFTHFNFETYEFTNEGITAVFDGSEAGWGFSGTGSNAFAFIQFETAKFGSNEGFIADPYYFSDDRSKFYNSGKILRIYTDAISKEEFIARLQARPMMIRYKLANLKYAKKITFSPFETSLNTKNCAYLEFNIGSPLTVHYTETVGKLQETIQDVTNNKNNINGLVKDVEQNKKDITSIDEKFNILANDVSVNTEKINKLEAKFTEVLGNYKIKVVEDGEQGTDENTLYFILE